MIDSEQNLAPTFKTIKIDPEIHRQIKVEASTRTIDIGSFVEALWAKYRDDKDKQPDPISVDCPVCNSKLQVTSQATEVLSLAPTSPVAIADDLRDLISEFVNLWRDPSEKAIKKYLSDYLSERRSERVK